MTIYEYLKAEILCLRQGLQFLDLWFRWRSEFLKNLDEELSKYKNSKEEE